MELNEIISRAAGGSEVILPSGEFEGPLIINKPLRVKGKNTTVWAKKSPVIRITSNGVTIENIRAEITEGSTEEPAVETDFMTAASNVEVLGRVSGFGEEDGFFDIPRTIELGRFPSERENSFKLIVNVPAKTEIVCEMREVRLEPKTLAAGRNELTITVNGISERTFLYAELLFKSRFTRRVYLTGRPDHTADAAVQRLIYTAPERVRAETDNGSVLSPQAVEAAAQAIHELMNGSGTDVISMAGKQDPSLPTLDMKRGQRVGLTQYLGERFEVRFSASIPNGVEIDPYVFLLGAGDRAIGDEGLIFFGNESSPNGEAKYFAGDGHIEIDLTKVESRVQKIAVAYSIYDGGAAKSFRAVGSPRTALISSGERVTFTMDGLSDESTIVALEFYLYKGEWKISAVGAGFKDGLAKLCNRYGIEVES